MQPFKTQSDRHAYADRCLRAGLDPEYVAAEMDYKNVAAMNDAIHQAKAVQGNNHRRHLIATIKALNAKRLMRRMSPAKAAKRAGYSRVDSMRRAIRLYTKGPAPTGIGNGADQNYHDQNTTKEADCQ